MDPDGMSWLEAIVPAPEAPEFEPEPEYDDEPVESSVEPDRSRGRWMTRGGVSASLRPIAKDRFGFDEARHLLLRAGFGGNAEQIATLVSWGPERSVDHLLNYESIPFEPVRADLFDKDIMRPANNEERGELARARRGMDEAALARFRASRQEAQRMDRTQMSRVQRWWLKRMIETPRPLEEKLTLFWHGHFATSYRTIEDSYHMFQQNQFFRRNAAGSFADLLFGIIRDPAMLAYLDNNTSRRGRPNENLARELMELFSLGVGNYTENDIQEGARALTGYTFDDDDFVFVERNHDAGSKRILGRSGTFNGEDFVRIILEQRSCSRFIANKLYRFFAVEGPPANDNVAWAANRVSAELATTLRNSRYRLKPLLRRLLLSEHFYDPHVMGSRIKSPVDLVVGAVRSLNTPVRDLGVLLDATALMGQALFYPPSVKGWDGGRSWINTSTMYVRQNVMCYLITGRAPGGMHALASTERFDALPALSGLHEGPRDPVNIAPTLLRFLLGRADSARREALERYAASSLGKTQREVINDMTLLVTAMPEYQLS